MNRIYQIKSLRDIFEKRPVDKPRKRWIYSVVGDNIMLLRRRKFSRRPSTMEDHVKGSRRVTDDDDDEDNDDDFDDPTVP
jgi:hypothetical protein